MEIANHVSNNSGFELADEGTGNVYLQESYCGLNYDISTSAEEVFSHFPFDAEISFPASYIP
jgi:hypothetical protein